MKNLLNKLFTILILFFISTYCKAQIRAMNGKLISEASMDEFLKREIESASIPGLSIAFINSGKIVYRRAIGLANLEDSIKVDTNTLFEAASLSKTVFAYYVMKLVDKGIIALDTPLYKYWPYPDIGYDDRYKLITARMALSHTTGLPNWRDDTPPDSILNIPKKGELYLNFLPGSRVSYSGEGFQYLAKAIAHLLTKNMVELGNIVYKDVCVPLGMKNSSWVWNDYVKQHKATGYINSGDSNNKIGEFQKFSELNAAASLRTNASEFAKFLVAMMNGEGLKKESSDEMLKAQSYLEKSQEVAWGLGISIIHQTPNKIRYAHNGNNGNFQANYVFYKEKKTGFVFFINNNMADGLMGRLEHFFTFGELYPKKAIAIPRDILYKYTGEYKDNENLILKVTVEDGRLFVQQDQIKYELYPSSKTEFFIKLIPAKIIFIKSANGRITALEVRQIHKTEKFKRQNN